jgi:hypothetical protein
MNLNWSIVEKGKAKTENKKAKKTSTTQTGSQSILQVATVPKESVDSSCAPKRKLHVSHTSASHYIESNSTIEKTKRSGDNVMVRHPVHLQMPQGTVWSNNSCAYDCVFFNSALHLVP